MKIRKAIAEIGLVFFMGMMTAGCAGKAQDIPQTEVKELDLTDERQDAQPLKEADREDAEEEADPGEDGQRDKDEAEDEKPDSGEPEDEKPQKGQTENAAEGTEYLGGKVQSPQEDGMTLAQTTLTDEDGMVTLLEVEDAKKIPVKFTADTKAEHWIIQGSGAGIDMKAAALSDLQEGMGVEVEGYFEGEVFVAVRVIIEEYR